MVCTIDCGYIGCWGAVVSYEERISVNDTEVQSHQAQVPKGTCSNVLGVC